MQIIRFSQKLIITAVTIGNILEWYEFGLYAYLAPILSRLFFSPKDTSFAAVANILLIFAIGFFARPIGGLLFGYIGDRYGRRTAILTSILCITIPTFAIGLLPTYAAIGYWSIISLGVIRFLQGIPVGGEFPGTICYLTENANAKNRGYLSSYAFFGSQIGTLINIIDCLFMEHFLSREELISWGWRAAFILGGLIGLFGLILRYQLKETPLFTAVEKQHEVKKRPILLVFKAYKLKMLLAFFLGALPLSGYYMIFVFTPVYFEQFLHMSYSQGLILNGLFLLLSTVSLPFLGKMADRMNKKKLLIVTAILIALLSYPLYLFASTGNLSWMVTIEALLILLITVHFALIPDVLSRLFPTSIRFTGLAFSYNMCNSLIAGSSPFLSLYLVKTTASTLSPSLVLIAISLMTLGGLFFYKEKQTSPLLQA